MTKVMGFLATEIMIKNIYDAAIIGAGIAGTFASLRITEKNPNISVILIDLGKGFQKRRRALEGWMGCFPSGDGKIYPRDLDEVKTLTDGRKVIPASKWVFSYFEQVDTMKLITDSNISAASKKKFQNSGFQIQYNSHYQWKPENVHKLSRIISSVLETNKNLKLSFDNEIFSIKKTDGIFELSTNEGEILCKKLILCTGRSGWRWATNLYDDLGIITEDDYAEFGLRVEIPAKFLKELNHSHFSLKKEDLEIGPFSWNGTVIPEDHSDLVLSSFRSNEPRWRSEKVSFPIIGKRLFKDNGTVQSDRIGKLSFLLYNDRISKDKIKLFLKGKCPISVIDEYNWLKPELLNLDNILPGLVKSGTFYVPMIIPRPAKINIDSNLESDIEGMFVAGENAGIFGIYAAATMGAIAADSICK